MRPCRRGLVLRLTGPAPRTVAAILGGLGSRGKFTGDSNTYVGRMLRLTSLAPDITEAILRGDEPDGLSLAKLRKNLQISWDKQRKNYGS